MILLFTNDYRLFLSLLFGTSLVLIWKFKFKNFKFKNFIDSSKYFWKYVLFWVYWRRYKRDKATKKDRH